MSLHIFFMSMSLHIVFQCIKYYYYYYFSNYNKVIKYVLHLSMISSIINGKECIRKSVLLSLFINFIKSLDSFF